MVEITLPKKYSVDILTTNKLLILDVERKKWCLIDISNDVVTIINNQLKNQRLINKIVRELNKIPETPKTQTIPLTYFLNLKKNN